MFFFGINQVPCSVEKTYFVFIGSSMEFVVQSSLNLIFLVRVQLSFSIVDYRNIFIYAYKLGWLILGARIDI
jgi:hypothetical protein